jgi:SWI/SNF-related matrix-associated actin-dependent regulator of chromatin subfamily A-like protein 1
MPSELWPHQAAGVAFILEHLKAALGHETGTGKTRTGIAIADTIRASFILVLCPVIAVEHWASQFDLYGQQRRTIGIVRSPEADFHFVNVLIVPFSLISKYPRLAKRLKQYNFDLILIDEAHALKTIDSNRTRAIYGVGDAHGGLVGSAPYVALLSATLMPNHPGELYPHLKALRPELLGPAQGYDTFASRYCETKTTWRSGAPIERIVGMKKNSAPDLKRRLETFVHRVRKKDVQKDLPPFTVDTWPVALADLTVPDEVKCDFAIAESKLRLDVGDATGEEALAIARGSPHAATQRRLTGIIKLQAMAAVLAAELEHGDHKVIAFAYHRDVLEALARRFAPYGVVTVDGSTSPAKRIANVKAFREDPKVRLFNGQISAAGEVIDLTPCSSMWIMESDWTPKTIIQAIGRANRPGQTEPLTVRMLTLAGSIDDALARTLVRKTRDIEMLEPV